jgi:hypothetical protein
MGATGERERERERETVSLGQEYMKTYIELA